MFYLYIGIFIIIQGGILVFLPEEKLTAFIKAITELRGLKPYITKKTIGYYRFIGAAYIAMGIIVAAISPISSWLYSLSK